MLTERQPTTIPPTMPPLDVCPLLHRLSPFLHNRNFLSRSIGGTVNLHDETSATSPPRLQRQVRPPPGRLLRRPADSSVKVTIASPDSSVDNQNTFNNASIFPGEVPKSRIGERREAIAKRRLFLEKGRPSLAPSFDNVESESSKTDSEKIEEPSNELLEQNASIPSMTTNPPVRVRSSVHSLNNGRKLSAADMHRLQRHTSTQDTSIIPPQQQQQQHQLPVKDQHKNKKIGRVSRETRHPTGGSIVASQSATARYRLQRRGQISHDETIAGANRRMNPSVLSIPLDDNGASSTLVVSSDDFDERLKKLRTAQRDKNEKSDGERGEKEGWSLFGWFWGKK
ncbi:hypothetical protein ACHAW6_006473 [Cyclotella cf. meneghiniana]